MTEYNNEYTKEMYERLKVFREAFLYGGIGRGLTLNNITFEGYDVKRGIGIDSEKIESLWMLSSHWMDEDIQEKLIRYMKEGGKLVLFPAIPTMDMKGNPCTKLLEALQVSIDESFWHRHVIVEDMDCVGGGYIETYKGDKLKAFGCLQESPDKVCAFERYIGKGKAVVLGIGLELEHYYKEELIKKLAARVNVYPVTDKEDYIDVSFRSIEGTNTRFMFIQNYDDYEKTMSFDYYGEILFDGHKLTINARTGLLLPHNYKVDEGADIIYTTCELVGKRQWQFDVFCRQDLEIIKLSKKPKILTSGIDYEVIQEKENYKLLIKSCRNKKVSVEL